MSKIKVAGIALVGMLSVQSGFCADKKEVLTLESIRIHGDQESPVVVYIVPWQAPVQSELDVQTANAVLRPLQPLDRESFQRTMSYHQLFQLQVNAEKKGVGGE